MQVSTDDPRTWRLRFTVTDEPGRLAAAASALAGLGVNIISSLDFHVVSATEVIDEATVSLPPWLDVPAVEQALRNAGAVDVWAVPIPVHELEDIASRVLRLATSVVGPSSDERSLRDAIARLVDAELVSTARVAAGPPRRRAAWRAVGRARPVRASARQAAPLGRRSLDHGHPGQVGPVGLTAREIEVLVLLARGATNKDIARRLGMAPKTASSHVEHFYTKLGVSTRAAAALLAVQHGLLPDLEPLEPA